MRSRRRGDASRFWTVVSSVVVADVASKALAVASLSSAGLERPLFGEWLRWKLVYNPGAAFGLHLGPYSRWIFMALTVGALVILANLFRETRLGDTWRTLAVSLVTAGALGNHEYSAGDTAGKSTPRNRPNPTATAAQR